MPKSVNRVRKPDSCSRIHASHCEAGHPANTFMPRVNTRRLSSGNSEVIACAPSLLLEPDVSGNDPFVAPSASALLIRGRARGRLTHARHGSGDGLGRGRAPRRRLLAHFLRHSHPEASGDPSLRPKTIWTSASRYGRSSSRVFTLYHGTASQHSNRALALATGRSLPNDRLCASRSA